MISGLSLKRVALVLTLLFLGPLVWSWFHLAEFAHRTLKYPYQLDFGEGFVIEAARRLAGGEGIYQDFSEDYNNLIAFYPPVFTLFNAATIKMVGVSFFSGRIISNLGILLSAILIVAIVGRCTRKLFPSLLAGAIFPLTLPALQFGRLARVDCLGVCFSLLGLYLFVIWRERKGFPWYLVLFFLAFFTKPIFVSVWLATLAVSMVEDRRRGLVHLAGLASVTLGVVGLLNWITHGQYYRQVFQIHSLAPFYFQKVIDFHRDLWPDLASLFLVALWFLYQRIVSQKTGVLFFYLVFVGLTSLSVGLLGAGLNHLVELMAVLCLVLGVCLSEIDRRLESPVIGRRLWGLCLWLVVLLSLLPVLKRPALAHISAVRDQQNYVSHRISMIEGEVLSEVAGFLVNAGRHEGFYEFFLFRWLSQAGWWDEGQLLEKIRRQDFELIVFESVGWPLEEYGKRGNSANFSQDFVVVVEENYQVDEHRGPYTLMVPRD